MIELEVQGDFKPKNSDSTPSEALAGMPADLVCRFAAMFNADRYSKQHHRWACVGLSGPMFFLQGVAMIDRPDNPESFHQGTNRVGPMTKRWHFSCRRTMPG